MPTLAQIHHAASWVWLYCDRRECQHQAPIALAVPMILYGVHASSETLRRRARCCACGGLGAGLRLPSSDNPAIGGAAFPVAEMKTADPARSRLLVAIP
jgi:hypothetical protein